MRAGRERALRAQHLTLVSLRGGRDSDSLGGIAAARRCARPQRQPTWPLAHGACCVAAEPRRGNIRRAARQARFFRHYVANATKDRHPRESGDPCGIGPRFRGDDGVVCGACEPCGVCYMYRVFRRCRGMRANHADGTRAAALARLPGFGRPTPAVKHHAGPRPIRVFCVHPVRIRHYVANATKYRHPRESGDPSGIGPRFRGDDGVVRDACEPCGVCYIVPSASALSLACCAACRTVPAPGKARPGIGE